MIHSSGTYCCYNDFSNTLENLEANNFNLVKQVYASNPLKAKVKGNHNENIKISNGDNTYLVTIPSMIFSGTGNILNSLGTYFVINKGKNLPYKLSSNDTIDYENGNEVMQSLKGNDNAKIVTVDITKIVNAKTQTERQEKIKEIFGTGGNEVLSNGLTSQKLLASFGVTGEEDLGIIETIITGESSSSISTSDGGGDIPGDTTPPTGGNFTINNGDASTNSTSVTLNITCPADAIDGNSVQVAYGNSSSPTNWTSCTSSISHTLTSGDGTKIVYIKFRDSSENESGEISDEIELYYTISTSCSYGGYLYIIAHILTEQGVPYNLSAEGVCDMLGKSYVTPTLGSTDATSVALCLWTSVSQKFPSDVSTTSPTVNSQSDGGHGWTRVNLKEGRTRSWANNPPDWMRTYSSFSYINSNNTGIRSISQKGGVQSYSPYIFACQ